jgi:hypothetical protein
MLLTPILDENQFLDSIQDIVDRSHNGSNYLDAVIEYSQIHDLDLEVLGEVIKRLPALMMKLQVDAEDLRFLKRTARLPI